MVGTLYYSSIPILWNFTDNMDIMWFEYNP